MFLSNFCCVSIMPHLCVPARILVSSCLCLNVDHKNWALLAWGLQKIGFGREAKVCSYIHPMKTWHSKGGIWNICWWKMLTFSIKWLPNSVMSLLQLHRAFRKTKPCPIKQDRTEPAQELANHTESLPKKQRLQETNPLQWLTEKHVWKRQILEL